MINEIYKNCYQLPWSETDNPNGWIEPTTYCQLKCPGCYRGIDKKNFQPAHADLSELKKQIDWFIKERNIHTLSISGGEPLLYPQIDDLLQYSSGKGLRIMLYTNGLDLTEKRIIELRDAGVTQLLVHIDRFQERPDLKPGEDHELLRLKFCEIFRHIEGIRLGFIQPLSADCSDELRKIIAMANSNIDVVNLLVFTMYRDVCWDEQTKKKINTSITVTDTVRNWQKYEKYTPAAFLCSDLDPDDITWLFANKVALKNKVLGYFSPSFYHFIQKQYYKKHGRFLFISRKNTIKPINLFKYLWIGSWMKIAMKYLLYRIKNPKQSKGPLYFQTSLIIRASLKNNGVWNLCKNCPDRIIYKGRLIPSCILEDLKDQKNENYIPVKL